MKTDITQGEQKMEILSTEDARKEFGALVQKTSGPCVSIFMPTRRITARRPQEPIRLIHLLKEAEDQLISLGLRRPEANKLLSPAEGLLKDSLFWQHQADGLAVYLADGFFRHYRISLEVPELAVVTDRFHLKPLFPLVTKGARFYILALSRNSARLFQANPYRIREVELESLPRGLEDALKYDDPEQQLQFHTRAPGGKGERAAIFHGQGGGADDVKDQLLRYFRQVNDGLKEFFRNQEAPLILAGVDYYRPIYQEANTYPHLLEDGVSGNPETLAVDTLHHQARRVVEPFFEKALEEATSEFQERAHTAQTSSDLQEIVPAAYHGRVDLLFVPVGVHYWGKYHRQKNAVELHPEIRPGDEDLLDFAAVHTFVNSGTVYALKPEKVPAGSEMAAVFRY